MASISTSLQALRSQTGRLQHIHREQEEFCPSSLQLVAGNSRLGPRVTWYISSYFSVVRETSVANVGGRSSSKMILGLVGPTQIRRRQPDGARLKVLVRNGDQVHLPALTFRAAPWTGVGPALAGSWKDRGSSRPPERNTSRPNQKPLCSLWDFQASSYAFIRLKI